MNAGAGIKQVALWLVVIAIAIVVYNVFNESALPDTEIPFSDFLDRVESGDVARVKITGATIDGELAESGRPFTSVRPEGWDGLVDLLREHGVGMDVEASNQSPYIAALISWAPMLILIGVWIFFMRQMQSGGNRALAFGKSRARLSSNQQKKVTFKDVAGADEAKEELSEIIEFLREPQKFQRLGGRIPKGVLLIGPPGTGKTLMGRAVAGEASVPFFSISGSDFVEMFVGVGASRVRDLFEQGKKNAPCIIFIDEIDAVGRHRGAGLGGGHDEREQTLNQLLVEMDGFVSNEGVILMAATNRPDVLDPALLRPGRFDRRVIIDRPDIRGREGILKVHSRHIPLDANVDLSVVARSTPGFSGADLENLVNEAALVAARHDRDKVMMDDFEYAKDKVLMGAERRSMIISDAEKRITAYHEAGHALVAFLQPNADPLHKVTIIPRGRALGVTQQMPLDDRHNYSLSYLETQVNVLLGGRIAEEIVLEEKTTGAGNDLDRVTELARRMVTEWGMSDRVGPLTFRSGNGEVFLGRDFAQQNEYSEGTARIIDEEIKRIVDEGHVETTKLLTDNLEHLHSIAKALLTREVLDAEDVTALIEGRPLPDNGPSDGPPVPVRSEPESDDAADEEPAIGIPVQPAEGFTG
ncbi:MAG TPA: ATP-dependent zinc metalloprotease FtsH [Acidobacteriota bacterium]|nr:ATP-dependent zinc metalloprotease FtsH [Acidobacteriota bacterium]